MQDETRRILETLDIEGFKRLWRETHGHLHQPESDEEALVVLHRARTEAKFMPLKLRSYSHRWLVDNGFESALPDELRAKAERMYPQIVEGVGIAVKARSQLMIPIVAQVRKAMENVVHDAYAGTKSPDPNKLRARMQEERVRVVRQLVGTIKGR